MSLVCTFARIDLLIGHSSTGRTIHELKSMACVVIIHQKQLFHRRVHRLHIKQSQVSYRQVQAGWCFLPAGLLPKSVRWQKDNRRCNHSGDYLTRHSIVRVSHCRLFFFIVVQNFARLQSSIDFHCNLQCPHKRTGGSYV